MIKKTSSSSLIFKIVLGDAWLRMIKFYSTESSMTAWKSSSHLIGEMKFSST